MNDSILGNDYYGEVRKRALKDVKEAKEKMNITIEKELYEIDLIGKLNAVNDMKDSLTYIEKEEIKINNEISLIRELILKYDNFDFDTLFFNCSQELFNNLRKYVLEEEKRNPFNSLNEMK